MPSSILLNGERIYRPGVYVRLVDQIAPPTSFSAGNIAVVGDFPSLKKGELYTFTSGESMRDLVSPNGEQDAHRATDDLKQLRVMVRAAFDQYFASAEGAIDSLTLVNVRDTIAASYTSGGLLLSSKLHGLAGNNLKVELAADVVGYTAYVKKSDGTILESFPNIAVEDTPDIMFENNGTADLLDVTIEVGLSSGGTSETPRSGGSILVQATRRFESATIQALPSSLLFSVDNGFGGGICSIISRGAVASVDHTVKVTGLDEFGSPATENITISSGTVADSEVDGAKVFSYIEKFEIIEPASLVSANIGIDVVYPIKSAPLSEVTDVGNFLQQIQAIDGRFTVTSPPAPVSADELDQLDSTSIVDTTVELTSLLYRVWERAFAASLYLDAVMETNEAPAEFDDFLTGGAAGSNPIDDDWTDAFSSLLYKNINILVPWTTAFAFHSLAKDHCTAAAKSAGLERCAWLATPKNLSVNTAYLQYSKELNDKNCAVVFQSLSVKRVSPEIDAVIREDVRWTALALAVLQGSTPPATPLTRKQLSANVDAVRNTQVPLPATVANEAIRKALVILTPNLLQRFWIERSVTSYLTSPSHPVFTEVSANESVNVSLRDLRAYLQGTIGSKASAALAGDVKQLVESRLAAQRENLIIAGFRNVKVSLVGDLLNVSYELAAMQPLNFIVVTATLQQF